MNVNDVYTTSEISEIVHKSNKYILRFVNKNNNLIEGRDYRKTNHGHYLFNRNVKDSIISENERINELFERNINNIDINNIDI